MGGQTEKPQILIILPKSDFKKKIFSDFEYPHFQNPNAHPP